MPGPGRRAWFRLVLGPQRRTHPTSCTNQLKEWFARCDSNGLDSLTGVQRAHIELYIRGLGERGLMDSSTVAMMHEVRLLPPSPSAGRNARVLSGRDVYRRW